MLQYSAVLLTLAGTESALVLCRTVRTVLYLFVYCLSVGMYWAAVPWMVFWTWSQWWCCSHPSLSVCPGRGALAETEFKFITVETLMSSQRYLQYSAFGSVSQFLISANLILWLCAVFINRSPTPSSVSLRGVRLWAVLVSAESLISWISSPKKRNLSSEPFWPVYQGL